jgi:hypothetical protein
MVLIKAVQLHLHDLEYLIEHQTAYLDAGLALVSCMSSMTAPSTRSLRVIIAQRRLGCPAKGRLLETVHGNELQLMLAKEPEEQLALAVTGWGLMINLCSKPSGRS